MARKLGAIVATMENLEQEEALANAEQGAAAQETATEVAEVNADVDQDVGEIAQTDAAIDDGEAAVGQLDELSGVAEDSLAGEGETVAEGEVGEEGPGLTEGEATMVEITHETIMRNLGLDYSRQTYTPESFGSKQSRRDLTKNVIATLEDAKEGIGAKIMSALKAAFDMMVGFIAKIINNRTLMEKHLVNLEARAKALKGGAPKEQTLSAGAAQLSLNGQANASTALEVLKATEGNLAIAKNIAELLYRAKEGSDGFDLGTKVQEGVESLPKNGEGSGILGGGKAFKVNLPGGNSHTFDTVSKASVSVEVIEVAKTAESIAAPSKNEILSVIAAARKALGALKDAEAIRSRLKGFVEAMKIALLKGVTAVTSRVGTEKSRDEGKFRKMLVDIAQMGRKFMGKIMTTIFAATFKSVKAAADYANAGIKNLGGEASAQKPAEAPAA